MCSFCFWYVSLLGFLKFLYVGSRCVSFIKDAFSVLSRFPLTALDSQGTLNLALGLVAMHSAAASILAVKKFHIIWCMSFRSLLMSIKLVCYSHRVLIAYITYGKQGPVIS